MNAGVARRFVLAACVGMAVLGAGWSRAAEGGLGGEPEVRQRGRLTPPSLALLRAVREVPRLAHSVRAP